MESTLIFGFRSVRRMRVFTPPGCDTNPSQVSFQQMMVLLFLTPELPQAEKMITERFKYRQSSDRTGDHVVGRQRSYQLRQQCLLHNDFKNDFTQVPSLLAGQRFSTWGHHHYHFKEDGDLSHDRYTHINTDLSPWAYGLTSLSQKMRNSSICRCQSKESTFSLITVTPWVLVRPGIEPEPPARQTGT